MERDDTQSGALTLVIDIGKSHAKLLMVDAAGAVVERHGRDNASVVSPLGYPALDVHGLEAWMRQTLRASGHTAYCTQVMASTHGAAVVALSDDGLAWEPLDYEFAALTAHPDWAQSYALVCDGFQDTLSPDLPAGLNIGRQLFWMQNMHPQAWRRTRCLLPYPQYWAWLLSGVRASEATSLGCHTQLWHPQTGRFSVLAQTQGWASLFAPLRSAWDSLGSVRAEVARDWGLPAGCRVRVGVHDSNACLARYIEGTTRGPGSADALTVVSSGTWTVVMAPGASAAALQADQDMLCNVDVLGRPTPTARFMGGREYAYVLDGAAPEAATSVALRQIMEESTFAIPAFSDQGGPFAGQVGYVQRQGLRLEGRIAAHLDAAVRSTLAATYCAQMTAWLVQRLWRGTMVQSGRVVVEGPLAHNPLYLEVLQALLPAYRCYASTDTLEGTARGTWALCQWGAPLTTQYLRAVQPCALEGLQAYHAAWLQKLGGAVAA